MMTSFQGMDGVVEFSLQMSHCSDLIVSSAKAITPQEQGKRKTSSSIPRAYLSKAAGEAAFAIIMAERNHPACLPTCEVGRAPKLPRHELAVDKDLRRVPQQLGLAAAIRPKDREVCVRRGARAQAMH